MSSKRLEIGSSWLNQFELLLLGATAIISGLVSLLDFLGVLDGTPWLSDRIPTLTLLAVGLVAAYLVIERRNQLEQMQQESSQGFKELEKTILNSTSTIIDSLAGIEFKKFETGNELMNYINKRVIEAHSKVDDLSWSPAVSLRYGLDITKQVNQKYEERVSKAAKKIVYREVFMFNRPGRAEKLKNRIEEGLPGYSCSYYPVTEVPLLQFMLIDEEEVIILSDQYPFNFALRHQHIVRLFAAYFNDIWQKSTPLKLGTTLMHEEINRVLSSHKQVMIALENSTVHNITQTVTGRHTIIAPGDQVEIKQTSDKSDS